MVKKYKKNNTRKNNTKKNINKGKKKSLKKKKGGNNSNYKGVNKKHNIHFIPASSLF